MSKKLFDYTDQYFSYEDDEGNGVEWKVTDVIKHTKNIKPVFIDVSIFAGFLDYVIKNYNEDDFQRVKDANLMYPIIVGTGKFTFTDDATGNEYPYIVDGVHRLVKCYQNGIKKISAVVTNTLPPPIIHGKGMVLNGMKYLSRH